MKVYVVLNDNWQEGTMIDSIWSTRELAEAALAPLAEDDRRRERSWGEYILEVWDVDQDES